MKFILFAIFIINGVCVIGQHSIVKGIVTLHNSKTNSGNFQFVSNAQVEDDFNKAQPTLTDVKGEFSLVYVGIPEKVKVSFNVKKPPLEVVNIADLGAVTGQSDFIRISMAKPGEISKFRREIYRVGKTQAEKKIESRIIKVNAELTRLFKVDSSNSKKMKQLELELYGLEQERKKIDIYAQELARRYARINLDDASPIFRKAFLLFQSGRLDSSLLILTKINLSNMVYAILEERKKLFAINQEISERDSLQKQRSIEVSDALRFKADLHKTFFDLDSTINCYKLLLMLDSNDINDLHGYAESLAYNKDVEGSINYFNKIVFLFKNKPDSTTRKMPKVAKALNNLAQVYILKDDLFNAQKSILEADLICKKLLEIDSVKYLDEYALIQHTFGNFYSKAGSFERAEASFMEALNTYIRLANNDSIFYDGLIAHALIDLGELYHGKGLLEKSEQKFMEALNKFITLSRRDPLTFQHLLIENYNSLGNLCYDLRDTLGAESFYTDAYKICKELIDINERAFEVEMAGVKANLGSLKMDTKQYELSESLLSSALKVHEKWMKLYPQEYSTAWTNNALILFELYIKIRDTTQNTYDKIRWQEKYINVYSSYYNIRKGPDTQHYLAAAYDSLAWYQLLSKKFKEAEKSAYMSKQVEPYTISHNVKLAHALLMQGKYDDAFKEYTNLKTTKSWQRETLLTTCIHDLNCLRTIGMRLKDINEVIKFLSN